MACYWFFLQTANIELKVTVKTDAHYWQVFSDPPSGMLGCAHAHIDAWTLEVLNRLKEQVAVSVMAFISVVLLFFSAGIYDFMRSSLWGADRGWYPGLV